MNAVCEHWVSRDFVWTTRIIKKDISEAAFLIAFQHGCSIKAKREGGNRP